MWLMDSNVKYKNDPFNFKLFHHQEQNQPFFYRPHVRMLIPCTSNTSKGFGSMLHCGAHRNQNDPWKCMLDYVWPPLLPGFSFASCCSLISHFKKHPTSGDVFPCMWISLTSHSLRHVSHPPRLQICMWRTSGPSFMNWGGYLMREGNLAGPPSLTVRQTRRVGEINVSRIPRSSIVQTKVLLLFSRLTVKTLLCLVAQAETMGTVYCLW